MKIKTSTASLEVRALIDSGAEISLVSQHLVTQLQLERVRTSTIIMGIDGKSQTMSKGIVSLHLQSLTSNHHVNIQAHIINKLNSKLPSHQLQHHDWPHLAKLTLADDKFSTPQPIDILIGANYYGQVIKPNIIKHHNHMPIAQLSIFGWLILGPCGHSHTPTSQLHHLSTQDETNSIQELLTRFWVQEEVPTLHGSTLTPEEQECEHHFMTTHQRHSSGKYIVKLPLKESRTTLGNSYNTALNCLRHLQKRLKNNLEYQQLYENFMNEYIQLGHMVKANRKSDNVIGLQSGAESERTTLAHDTSVSGGLRVLEDEANLPKDQHQHQSVYYLPHHGVLRPESTSTKLRVVFNGSKPTTSGRSLNDIMHVGAKIQKDITDVLLWIRKHQFIFTTDVTKMYRQIEVHKDDWDLQRILWFDEHGNITPYQLTTVTYGTRAAPFLAIRALLQLAEDEGHNYPLAVDPIIKGRYVDDIIGGADTRQQLVNVARQLNQLCTAGGLPLAKWQFNDPIAKENFLRSTTLANTSTVSQDSTISFGDCATKILGIIWHPAADHFTFSTKHSKTGSTTSKRTILSEVAQIYDPLGFISPITIRAKILLQELWLQKSNWDDPLPPATSQGWKNFKQELTALESIKIPRWTHTLETSSCELHGFADASQLAMAAVVFLKVTSPSGTSTTSLLCSKTKVAPLKRLTIPRLELTAALLLAKIVKYAHATLEININKTYLWTDSSVTLTWIKSHPSKWKDFVRNRVTQIQELTSTHHWMHVPGKSNPADCASRGTSTKILIDHSLWWSGPPWLSKSQSHWPAQPTQLDDAPSQEARSGISHVLTLSPSTQQWDLIHRYSNFTRLIRITSIVMQATNNFKRVPGERLKLPLSPRDLDKAKEYWIRSTQQAYFTTEINIIASGQHLPHTHVLNKLTAFIDANGILRVGGRLKKSPLDPDSKHPAILPRHSPLSNLIIDQAHKDTLHGGTQITLATIRQQYWIVGGRAPVRSHILRCVTCTRYRGRRAQQLMGQLPTSRVTPSRPFQHTGVDYAGPINIKSWKGRGSKVYKAWICVFTCMTTSATHLEAVTDYATDGFLAAYRRFTSRRGLCQALYSDCGKNFIGADAELKRLFTESTKEHQRIANLISNDHTQWHFNPPSAPHMGGKWESVVKSIKFHLRRTVKDVLLTLEEFTTLLTQIEGLLNSRPMEPLTDDPDDLMALTPGHFITGTAITSIPEPTINEKTSPRTSWRQIQQNLQQFWRQWSTSVLQRQLAITKWYHKRHDIKLGSLVLLTDERFPPSKWPLARVIKLHPGDDGLTRVVTIKTSTTTLTRPIAKLAILPVATQEDNITQEDITNDDLTEDNQQSRC